MKLLDKLQKKIKSVYDISEQLSVLSGRIDAGIDQIAHKLHLICSERPHASKPSFPAKELSDLGTNFRMTIADQSKALKEEDVDRDDFAI